MNILLLKHLDWFVYAYCDPSDADKCPVMDTLVELADDNYGAVKMLKVLIESAPANGPMFNNKDKVKLLRDKIYEFREQPRIGPKVRVLFFRSDTKSIVCTNAFDKDQRKTPEGEIDKAVEIREKYMADKRDNKIFISSLTRP